MKAYVIFDGGGVKGAALAGCLSAAENMGIQFEGFGGTSAGSIVALLACAGYNGKELKSIMVDEMNFTDLLDDSGVLLDELKELAGKFTSTPSALGAVWKHRKLLLRISQDLGLYNASKLKEFLMKKLKAKLPDMQNNDEITFEDLKLAKRPPLKIMVSDIVMRKPRVYSGAGGEELNGFVLEAIRASMSYPFVFQPVQVHDRILVDGGLSSNLPLFMFEDERKKSRLPVIAFDLTSARQATAQKYGLRHFCSDMLSTAIESGDILIEKVLHGVYHVRIPIPETVDTLDFSISKAQREQLFNAGYVATHQFFNKSVPQWMQARNPVEALQALFAEPRLVRPLLQSFAAEVERATPARNTRAHVMLPTPRQTRIVVYQYNMDEDADSDLELAMNAGCSGRSWTLRNPVVADMEEAKSTFAVNWFMTREQQNKIRPDRNSMMSIPIFDRRSGAININDLPVLGILSIDSSTPLEDTQWRGAMKGPIVEIAKRWSDIISRVLH